MGILGVLLGYIIRDQMSAAPGGPTKEEGQALEDSLDKRARDPNFEQLAGRKCVRCKSNIVTQREGQRCPTCAKPIHTSCIDAHVATCGAPPAPPYR